MHDVDPLIIGLTVKNNQWQWLDGTPLDWTKWDNPLDALNPDGLIKSCAHQKTGVYDGLIESISDSWVTYGVVECETEYQQQECVDFFCVNVFVGYLCKI